jgi:hypothetical protein
MKAEIIDLGGGERVVIGKIKPLGAREFCRELHRGESGKFANMHVLLTRDELAELGEAVRALLEAASPVPYGPRIPVDEAELRRRCQECGAPATFMRTDTIVGGGHRRTVYWCDEHDDGRAEMEP